MCTIDLTGEPDAKFTVQVRLKDNNSSWKRDWYFEGITVTPDSSRGKEFAEFKAKHFGSVTHRPLKEPKKAENKGSSLIQGFKKLFK